MPTAPASPPEAFAKDLEQWFARHRKDYPWRRTRDPYAILVAEIMLQQTQIATVLDRGFYERWMAVFPTFASLADAAEDVVLRAWEGLGYYRRARNLQRLAQVIMTDHAGQMPRDPAAILALPGIGPYTAGALSSFAFGLHEPIVDGNIARVLSRVFNDRTPIDSTLGQRQLWDRARTLVQAASLPGDFNSALMELGQTLCRPTDAACDRCPVSPYCRATEPLTLPIKAKHVTLTEVTERAMFCRQGDAVLLEQEQGSRRTGMWKLPALPADAASAAVLHRCHYGITRYKVTLWIHAHPAPGKLSAHQRWVTVESMLELPMPAPYRRVLQAVLDAARPFALT
jgi:A/G-specific adenine glycosylase